MFSFSSQGDVSDVTSTMEVSRLKEEVEVLRNELHRAEIELEDRCWVAPTVLQHWLQLTYELELQTVSGTN
jgi:stromal interaction molecule 1